MKLRQFVAAAGLAAILIPTAAVSASAAVGVHPSGARIEVSRDASGTFACQYPNGLGTYYMQGNNGARSASLRVQSCTNSSFDSATAVRLCQVIGASSTCTAYIRPN